MLHFNPGFDCWNVAFFGGVMEHSGGGASDSPTRVAGYSGGERLPPATRRGLLPSVRVLGMCLLLLIVTATPAQAADNHCWLTGGTNPQTFCDIHWHGAGVMLFQHESSIPWPTSVYNAATSWRNGTKFKPIAWAGTTINRVSMKTIPASLQSACPRATALACASASFSGGSANPAHPASRFGHIGQGTIIYNIEFSADFTTNCLDATRFDVQTIALHEFGHLGALNHSVVPADTMFEAYTLCNRDLSLHAISSMDGLYTDAGH